MKLSGVSFSYVKSPTRSLSRPQNLKLSYFRLSEKKKTFKSPQKRSFTLFENIKVGDDLSSGSPKTNKGVGDSR